MAAYGALAQETMERARQRDDQVGLCVAYMMQCNHSNYTGRFAAAEEAAVAAARHLRGDRHDDSFLLSGLDITLHTRAGRMMAQSFLGDRVGVDRSMAEILQLAGEQRQVRVLVWLLGFVLLPRRARFRARRRIGGEGHRPGG